MPGAHELPPSIDRLARFQAAVMTDRHWDAEIEQVAGRLRAICPALATERPPTAVEQTPAEVLRELGGRLLVTAAKHGRYGNRHVPSTGIGGRLLRAVGQTVRKLAGIALLMALIYFGIRLFGDDAMLAGLDRAEARLQIGWSRLLKYIGERRQ
jgi:hypothetical protein